MKHFSLLFLMALLGADYAQSQTTCNWITGLNDSFEYTTVCPDLIPGQTVHNTPQTFAAHTGQRSLYMNFVNCSGSTGACAGDTIYLRTVDVCPNVQTQLGIFLTTTFSGTQCDIHVSIIDSNGTVLFDAPSIPAAYQPQWTDFLSTPFTPTSSQVQFVLITNVSGSAGGNDLSLDDFRMMYCYPAGGVYITDSVCTSDGQIELLDYIPGSPMGNGTWQGPLPTAGGSMGILILDTVLTDASFYYSTYPFGNVGGCPALIDTVVLDVLQGPLVTLGNDTTVCPDAFVTYTAGSAAGQTYSWSNGSTSPSFTFNNPGVGAAEFTYWVAVTYTATGCVFTDSVTINYVDCSGLEESAFALLQLQYIQGRLNVKHTSINPLHLTIYSSKGQMVLNQTIRTSTVDVSLPAISEGLYYYKVTDGKQSISGKLYVSKD